MWTPLGDRAIRFPRPAAASARAIVRTARTWPGVVDVVVASRDVAVYFVDTPAVDPSLLHALDAALDEGDPPRELALPAIYDGPDLDDVARATGLAPADVVSLHASAVYTVDTMGFAPGFAYLTGLPARLHLPRRATPRTRVPAGSLAIAAGYTAVYPFDSPGGWHLLGRVSGVRMFGPDGALLRLGDRVRFTP
ncbi:MAG TPA: carboxyltransferase domain-containing protein [Kofleriaceae bacterium]|nr:carboxyltransferase domain-containing protein [Kofleriaceae bacterium]